MAINNQTFYKSSFEKHGSSPLGLHWNSLQSQEIRFEVIANWLRDEIPVCTIADAGCGFGDLFLFLQAKGLRPKHYLGIDVMEEFIHIAQERLQRFSHCKLTCKDILKDELPFADWYVCSGAMNILSNFNTWLFIEKMLASSRKGVVFNMLEGKRDDSFFNYKEKLEIIDFLESKGLQYEMVEGYLEHDISVKIRL